jgi:hypothetical protein
MNQVCENCAYCDKITKWDPVLNKEVKLVGPCQRIGHWGTYHLAVIPLNKHDTPNLAGTVTRGSTSEQEEVTSVLLTRKDFSCALFDASAMGTFRYLEANAI